MKKKLLMACFVPIIMLLFFIRNIVLENSNNLDSWMGGGMRMFGKIDKMLYRVSGMTIMHNDTIYFVNFRNFPELKDLDVANRIMPSDKRLENFYSILIDMDWCYDPNLDIIKLSNPNCTMKIPKDQIIEIQVYRTDFNDNSNQVSLKLINSYSNGKKIK